MKPLTIVRKRSTWTPITAKLVAAWGKYSPLKTGLYLIFSMYNYIILFAISYGMSSCYDHHKTVELFIIINGKTVININY